MIWKVSLGDGNITLVRAESSDEAEQYAYYQWGAEHGPYNAVVSSQSDVDYAVSLDCQIHDPDAPPAVPSTAKVLVWAFRQNWKRVERAKALGPAPTASYHLSSDDAEAFVKQHWRNMPRYPKGEAPEYLSPDGPPEAVEIEECQCATLKLARASGAFGVKW